jgi:hypothetical protein
MYYTIIGDIQFGKDEEWKDEASIEKVVTVAVSQTLKEAEEQGEFLSDYLGGLDWLVPQAFGGRIYNTTANTIILSDAITVPPQSKIEWAGYQKVWVEQGT